MAHNHLADIKAGAITRTNVIGMEMNEQIRNAWFNACPILQNYLSTALQDLQFSEMDDSCMESRDERDTGTIYDCPDKTFQRALTDCQHFMNANHWWITRATELEPGEDGLRYGRHYVTHERIGSTFYLARIGSGVTFTDDGDDQSLQIMADYARSHSCEGLYFGDDGKVYWM